MEWELNINLLEGQMRWQKTEVLRVDATVELSGRERIDDIQITFRIQEAKWKPFVLRRMRK
jgi:hypothetical protein